jgi:lysozyme
MDMNRIRDTLVKHEGLRLDLYQDHLGIYTVGVGHNIQERGISERVAYIMLEEDINVAVEDLQRNISYFDKLPECVQEALVNLSFNLGIPRLMSFKKTLAYLREGKWEKAANELLDSRYATQVGYRAVEVAAMIRGASENA